MRKHMNILIRLMVKNWIYDWSAIKTPERPKYIRWYINMYLKNNNG